LLIGLREFYSVVDLPGVDAELNRARTRVEGAVNWLRQATNALARARMDEQQCVLRLTIEPRQGDGGLLQELNNGYVLPFPPVLIAGMTRPHLIGIMATAEPLAGDSWLNVKVACPEQKLSANDIPLPAVTARLGRVSSSASLNVRDLGGGRPIVNRSPIGDWTVQAINDHGAEQMNRLHLDFHLAFNQG